MKRLKKAWGLMIASVAIAGVVMCEPGSAQLALKLVTPDGKTTDISGRNVPRGDESLVLYDKDFGKTTHTNPYGVEVMAAPLATKQSQDAKAYEVTGLTSVWECQKDSQKECGNAAIPAGGVVLSATGSKRDLLKQLHVGDQLKVEQEWFHQKESPISVINPSPLNNPIASGFPGYRASNQLIVYNTGYGAAKTGTNEFGFEVTVRNGIVVAQEGSDSTIPEDGFVVSGHGRARSWLIANAPLGAKLEISPDGQTMTSTIDYNTYAYQFDQRWAQSPCANAVWGGTVKQDDSCTVIRNERDQATRLYEGGKPSAGAELLTSALESLNHRIWMSYDAFPATAIRGVWHRPVEKNAADIGHTLDRLQAAGLNSVFLETFFHGYTIFPSQTYAEYGLTTENPKFAGTDLLKLWVEEAHKRNMQVHVWFQTFYGGTKAYKPPGPILAKYPQWANIQYSALVPVSNDPHSEAKSIPAGVATPLPVPGTVKNGSEKPAGVPVVEMKAPDKPVPSTLELGAYFLDPANPEVQQFLMKLSKEIVTRYNVDGFQLDYIRYPASFPADRFSYRKTTWGYTDIARHAFKAQYGIDPVDIDPKNPDFDNLWKAWNAYKVAQVNNFVNKVTHSLRDIKPNVKLSAAVFPEADGALALKHQDWRSWGVNGWLDFFAPMTLTSATKVVARDTRYMVGVTSDKVPVYSGIFGPFNENSAEHVLTQIDTAKMAGAKGYVLFDTAHLTPRMLEALQAMQVAHPVVTPAVEEQTPVQPAPQPVKPKKRHWWQRNK